MPKKGYKQTIQHRKNLSDVFMGWKLSEKTRKKISNTMKNRIFSAQHKKNLSKSQLGRIVSEETKKKISFSKMGKMMGKNHPRWKGRNRKKENKRNDSFYKYWVNKVKKRDNNICKLKNEDCDGYKVVHHIFAWRNYPLLRYRINNGITLCQFHHPKKRVDEIKLIPTFLKINK